MAFSATIKKEAGILRKSLERGVLDIPALQSFLARVESFGGHPPKSQKVLKAKESRFNLQLYKLNKR